MFIMFSPSRRTLKPAPHESPSRQPLKLYPHETSPSTTLNTLNKCKIVQSKLACFWAFLCLWECGECRIHRGNTQCFRDMLLINLQPFVYKGLSLFMCVGWSRRMGLSHSRGLAVGLFYPLDLRLWTLCLVVWVLPMLLPEQLHRMLPYPSGAGSVSYPPLPDAYSDTGGSRCLRWSVSFRVLTVPIWAVVHILSW